MVLAIDAIARDLKALAKLAPSANQKRLELIERVAEKTSTLDQVCRHLKDLAATATRDARSAREGLRESLLLSAKAGAVPHKRYETFDRVGIFKIEYKKQTAVLRLGSETHVEVPLSDGSSLFKVVQEEQQRLESAPFDRSDFFKTLRTAFQLASTLNATRNGKIGIKALLPYVVIARSLANDDFKRNPTQKTLREYSMARFAYEFARFGSDGWECQGLQVVSQTPNMATVEQGKSVTLPSLSIDKEGSTIGVVCIVKSLVHDT